MRVDFVGHFRPEKGLSHFFPEGGGDRIQMTDVPHTGRGRAKPRPERGDPEVLMAQGYRDLSRLWSSQNGTPTGAIGFSGVSSSGRGVTDLCRTPRMQI